MPHTLTWPEVWARRLSRHFLLRRASNRELVTVTGAVCGIHAQMLPAAELSLGLRVEGLTQQVVRSALWQQRSLVKTYGIRGTIHLFPSDELPLWMAALRYRDESRELARLSQMGLSAPQLSAIVDAIGQALDGQRLTIAELGEEVARRAGAWALDETAPAFGGSYFPRWRMALGWAATQGQLCFGPNQGTAVTFVRPDQWLGSWQHVDPADAIAQVLRRYLRAYGPATARDFGQWFNLKVRSARSVVESLAGELQVIDVEGYRCLQLAADDAQAAVASAADSVRLLPHFDCYLRGSHPRERLTAGFAARAAGGTGTFPVLLVGGTVGGVWQRRSRARRSDIRVESFVPLSPAQQDELADEVARIGHILETETTLSFGSVEVRPHL